MKKWMYWCIACTSLFCILFQVIFYMSFVKMTDRKKEEKKIEEQVKVLATPLATIDQAVSVNQADEILLQPGAEYECIIYNRDTGEQKKEMGRIPSEFVGCKREDIEKYLKKYMEETSTEKELVSYEMISFSSDALCVKKIYEIDKSEYAFLLVVENNEIVVYDAKWKNVYERTGIQIQDLLQEEQEKLIKGMYVKDEKELYSILEDYSS